MSRLDHHVALVQNKLALARFVEGLARALLVFAGVVWAGILIDKFFRVRPPQHLMWIWAGLVATVVAAIVYAVVRRPSPKAAAVAIDQKLGLKEKISTAIYMRPSDDPFAMAAVRDAENTAEKVVIEYRRHFPMRFPRISYAALGVALLALLTARFMSPLDLFGREEKQRKQIEQQAKVDEAKRTVENALATVNSVPRAIADNEAIKLAKADLANLLNQPIKDPDQTKRSAYKALQDMNAAIKQQIESGKDFAQAQNDAKLLRSMEQPVAGEGPISEAHRSLAKGDFDVAMSQLEQSVEKFDKMDAKDQQKAAEQMQKLSSAMQKMANDPKVQQQIQQQMQQMGMNQQQAQQAQELMQQAAQGDKQAQQQLQQMAQQMMRQMNNGQGPTDKQMQQIQQMMQQMQAMANSQATAQQMAQAAQQMAKAMQQQQQQAQQGQQAAQKPNQQNQQPQQQQQQQMAQAMKQMQQQMQQMQAAAQDAQQIAAAQQAGQAAQDDAQNAMNGQGAQQQGDNQPGNWNAGQNAQGQNPGQWNGQANNGIGPNPGGIGAGDRTFKQQAPFGVKPEVSPSQEDEKGKILASNFIKDNKPIKGQSNLSLKDVARSATNEQTDEIDQERVSRSAQKVVREYFNSMEKEESPNAPTTAPGN